MEKNLVIVESPAKARTIEKYLGGSFIVRASIGHIKDLPTKKLGVDIKNNFKPDYEVIKGKDKVMREIKKTAQTVAKVFLAPDPDREGEAIAWHVAEELRTMKPKEKAPPIFRILFNEITKKGILEAIEHPVEINQNMFEAQQARRILDRIVGYQISPLLWDKVRRGLSAGRVQSVAVRIVCEREKEIKKFEPEEYWNLEVRLSGSAPPPFTAKLHKQDGKKVDLKDETTSLKLVDVLKKSSFVLQSIQKKDKHRYPSPPFITSKLQQEASRKLGFSPKKTMMLAQTLYEGVEMEGGEITGLITYMRTDSVRVADSALSEVRGYISKTYGNDYLPEKPIYYKSKKGAQDAHEAIRPTNMAAAPELIHPFLNRDQCRLYELIWKRFVASQMTPALIDQTTFVIMAERSEFRVTGSVIVFPGFISVYTEGFDPVTVKKDAGEEEEGSGEEALLPPLKEGEYLKPLEFLPSQHFTQPPPRFTEASLVKELEENGIGRPSTYAAILSTIQEKKYVEKTESKSLRPTDLGVLVNELLVKHFPGVLDTQFTARMEEELDEVEEGKMKWVDALKEFYTPFSEVLEQAKVSMRDVKRQEIPTKITCEKCGFPLLIKFGRHGEFLACQNYPDCKNTKEFRRDEAGEIEVIKAKPTGVVCEKCGAPMIVKRGRFGSFLACSEYPKCKSTKPIPVGVPCPKCGKDITERRTRRGRSFYGCTGYPACDFASWNKPVKEACPECNSPYLVEKYTKMKGVEIVCPQKGCSYLKAVNKE